VTNAELAEKVPMDRILGVQLDDAPTLAEANLVEETLNRRLVPGDGDIDLPEVLRILRDGGSPAPLGIEVFCEELFSLPANEVAIRCADGVREALAKR
jgi:sugar phosphate isomerase/epimerase